MKLNHNQKYNPSHLNNKKRKQKEINKRNKKYYRTNQSSNSRKRHKGIKKTKKKKQRNFNIGTECPLSLGNGRSPYGYINKRLQMQFGAPDDERCAAQNMLSLQKTLE